MKDQRRIYHGERKGNSFMPIKDPDLFPWMLSDLRQGAQSSTTIFQDSSQIGQELDVKEALEARVCVSGQVLNTLDECFKLVGQKPQKMTRRLQEVFVEDFKRELAEIQSPEARRPFIVMKAIHLVHFRNDRVCGADRRRGLDRSLRRRSSARKLFGGPCCLRGANATACPKADRGSIGRIVVAAHRRAGCPESPFTDRLRSSVKTLMPRT